MSKVDKNVLFQVLEHYLEAKKLGFPIVGVFLQGSQNYELEHEGSDVDTKAIVLPNLDNFIDCKTPKSYTHVRENNEHIDIKDIRLMFDCFRKQNINFVEILFSKYRFINDEYAEIFEPMLKYREEIAHFNPCQAMRTMCGMAHEKYKALEHPYPATLDKIIKYGYDGKQLSHELRLLDFMTRYANGELYEQCLIPKEKEYLIAVKRNEFYNLNQAREVAKETLQKIDNLKESFIMNNKQTVNDDINELFNDVIHKILVYQFKKEINN